MYRMRSLIFPHTLGVVLLAGATFLAACGLDPAPRCADAACGLTPDVGDVDADAGDTGVPDARDAATDPDAAPADDADSGTDAGDVRPSASCDADAEDCGASPTGDAGPDAPAATIVCPPGEMRCDADGRTLEQCSASGTQWDFYRTCSDAFRCSDGACVADSCAGALDVTAQAAQPGGYTLTAPWVDYDNDIAGHGCGLGNANTAGSELIFSVTLSAGQVLRGRLRSSGTDADPALALMPTCTDVDDTCLAGATGSDAPAELTYKAPRDETVFVMVESDDPSTHATFDLQIAILAGCDVATYAPICAGSAVEYCRPPGYVATYACAGGCTDGACGTKRANWCFDAPDLTTDAHRTGGATVDIDWASARHTNDMFADGTCGLADYRLDGGDAYYRVDMQAGEVLEATLDNGQGADQPALVITGACEQPETACLASQTASPSASVRYLAHTDQTVYLVADNDNQTGSTDTFHLNATLTRATCLPWAAAPRCADSSTLEFCGKTGSWVPYSCACHYGHCVPRSGQICNDAIMLHDGDSDVETFSGVRAIEVPAGSVGQCNFGPTGTPTGPDHIYAIDLFAGQTLTVTYQTGVNVRATNYGVMYLLGDCFDMSSCLVNGGAYSSNTPGTLTYTASQDGTVYLVVANVLTAPTTGYDYQIDVSIQ